MILFNKPFVPTASIEYSRKVLNSIHQQGDGTYTEQVQERLAEIMRGGKSLLTPSCTHALEMASMLIDLKPGDEVILPSYTFTSAALAITKFGATPVFVDIDRDTKGINVEEVKKAITTKTRAISWVNYAGVPPSLKEIVSLAKSHDLFLIEDNAHGLGGGSLDEPLGTMGDFSTHSFHATKNIQCGEGGSLTVNNPDLFERAMIIREKGTDRRKFLNGEVQKYQWIEKGSSYLLAESLAAILLGQLEIFSWIQGQRSELWKKYFDFFQDRVEPKYYRLPFQPVGMINSFHMFYLEFANAAERSAFSLAATRTGIQTTFHYVPLHSSLGGVRYGTSMGNFEITNSVSSTLLRFPLYPNMDGNLWDLLTKTWDLYVKTSPSRN
jgi:dTDP-4-amino-4,6-dideoxygalactose transaminase